MAKGWKCGRCSTQNDEGTYNCSNCGLIKGGVVVPGSWAPPVRPSSDANPTPPEASAAQPVAAESTAPIEEQSSPAIGSAAAEGVGVPPNLDFGGPAPTSGWVLPAPTAPATSVPIWRRLPLRLALIVIVLAATGVGGLLFNASRSSSGDITKGGDLALDKMQVGDCWDLKDPSAKTIDTVTGRPCTQEHEFEVFYIGSMPAGDFPTDAQLSTFLNDNCEPAFDAYIGKAYADSELEIDSISPSTDSWASGDRTVLCSAYHPRIHRLTASLKGSAQ